LTPRLAHRPGHRWFVVLLAAIALLGGCDPKLQIDDIRDHQASGRFAVTVEPLRELMEEKPDDSEVNHLYGLALLRTGQPSLAIWSLREAAQDPDRAVEDGILLVQAIMGGGSAEDAALAASRILELEPENVETINLLIAARLKARQNEEALVDVERLLELKPGDSNAMISRLVALLSLDRADEAEAALSEISEAIKNRDGGIEWEPRVCGGTATFMKEKGDAEAAELLWNECLEQFPGEELIVFSGIEFFNKISQPRRGIEILRRAVETEPTSLLFIDALANRLALAGETEEAERLLLAATEDGVNDKQAWFTLSDYHELRGDPAKAAEAMAQGLERVGEVPPLMVATYVDLLIRAGDYDKAESIIPKFGGDPVYTNFLSGRLLVARGKPREAIEALEAGLLLWPDNSAARELLAAAAEQLGDYDRAVSEYVEALRIEHGNKTAFFNLLRVLAALGRDAEANSVFDRYWRERPDDPESLVEAIRFSNRSGQQERLDWAIRRLGQMPGQRARLTAELATISVADLSRPINGPALRALVEYLIDDGKTADALSAADAAVTENPEVPLFHEVRADALRAGGKLDLARKALDRALDLEPGRASALAKLASLAAERGDRNAAIALYDRAIRADPDESDYAWQAIQLFVSADENPEAGRRLDELLIRDTVHGDAAGLRARQLIESDPERALLLARRAVRLGGGADAFEVLGRAYLVSGAAEQAVIVLGRSVELQPDRPSSHDWLGMALSTTSDPVGAKRELNAALSAGDFAGKNDAEAELARLNAE